MAVTVLVLVGFGTKLISVDAGAQRLPRRRTTSVVVIAVLLGVAVSVILDRGATVVAAVLAAACTATAIVGWRRRSDDVPSAAFGVLATGWGIAVTVECVVFNDDLARMNTVFKWWFHAWALIAVGCAGSVAVLLPRWRHVTTTRRVGRAAIAAVVVAAMAAVAFGVLAVPARLEDRVSTTGASLDGMDWLDAGLVLSGGDRGDLTPGDDRVLIEWIRGNVDGMPTLLEAPGEQYDWVGRVSALTGLPTVIGWPYHESQQRPSAGSAIGERFSDATAFYRATDPDVEVVFDDGRSVIATVDHACLDPRAATWSFDHDGQVADVFVVG
jgi:uncharacterized membrane protein